VARVINDERKCSECVFVYIFVLTVFCSCRDSSWRGTTLSEYYLLCPYCIIIILTARYLFGLHTLLKSKDPRGRGLILNSNVKHTLYTIIIIIIIGIQPLWKYYFRCFFRYGGRRVLWRTPCTSYWTREKIWLLIIDRTATTYSCSFLAFQIRRCELTWYTRQLNIVYTIQYYILQYLCNRESSHGVNNGKG